ncbi:Chromosome partition protein Smc [Carpediemonas membranifera]|uniref:Chromosome partition protein Smc n=1 Tax=Carpediemonas membranifera TaxID=201153 RepID=A0A8J6B5P6_9EUKA|nr:Chromosome partition protein Smc [Carpediemonas membranifera]|eukprot:KAG9393584.1 Chromosome partition protein Smc [Carpediemonas membranifera]
MLSNIRRTIDQTLDSADKKFEAAFNPAASTADPEAKATSESAGYVMSLENMRDVLQSELRVAEKKIATLSQLLDASSKSKKSIQERLAGKETELQAIHSKLDSYQSQLDTMTRRLEETMALVAEAQEARDAAQSELAEVRTTELGELKERHSAEVAELSTALDRLREEHAATVAQQDRAAQSGTEELRDTRERLEVAEARVAEVEALLEDHRQAAAELLAEAPERATATEAPDQTELIDTLRDEVAELTGRLQTLSSVAQAARADADRYKQKFAGSRGEVFSTQQELTTLRGDKLELQGQLATLETDNAQLQTALDAKVAELEATRYHPADPTPDQARLEQLQARLREKQEAVEKLRARVFELEAEARSSDPYTIAPQLARGKKVTHPPALAALDELFAATIEALSLHPLIRVGVSFYVITLHVVLVIAMLFSLRGRGES